MPDRQEYAESATLHLATTSREDLPSDHCFQARCPGGVNAKIIGRFGDADDFLDCFIIPARIVGGTFWG